MPASLAGGCDYVIPARLAAKLIIPPERATMGDTGTTGGTAEGGTEMGSWTTELPAVIRMAISQGGGEVVVMTETQCELGRTALARMDPEARGITFRADPSAETPRLEARAQ